MSLTEEKANEIAQRYNSDLIAELSDEIATLQAEADVFRNTISLLKNENERMMKLAHDYITAYEKLAFSDVVTDTQERER